MPRRRKQKYALNDETLVSQTVDIENFDIEKNEEDEKEHIEEDGMLHKIFKAISFVLKFWSFGQYITKFYRKKKARYSSLCGGLISILLCVFIFMMIFASFWNLFRNNDFTMTWGTSTI